MHPHVPVVDGHLITGEDQRGAVQAPPGLPRAEQQRTEEEAGQREGHLAGDVAGGEGVVDQRDEAEGTSDGGRAGYDPEGFGDAGLRWDLSEGEGKWVLRTMFGGHLSPSLRLTQPRGACRSRHGCLRRAR